MGRSAASRRRCSASMSDWPGFITTGAQGSASATSTLSVSMSSGSAMTTGPGRPCVATWKARLTISGMRSARSISTTHLAMEPKTAL